MSQTFFGRATDSRGISLIEITVLITVIAIVAAIAMQSLTHGIDQGRKRKTEREMTLLQHAIAGNPSKMSVAGGMRCDFGYVGDVGAFPPDINALFSNPGGYATWNGPYVPVGYATDATDLLLDEWGNQYSYNGGLEIVSSGSGGTMRKGQSGNEADYLFNTVNGVILDRNDSIPALTWKDSVDIQIVVPDGLGSLETRHFQPDSSGEFVMDSLPVGRHLVRAIFVPEVDTLLRYVHVMPRHNNDEAFRLNFAEGYFDEGASGSDSMLTLVEGSQSVYGQGADCNNIRFDIANNTGEAVELTSIELTWDSPVAYYQEVWWGPDRVWVNASPRNGSSEIATFDSPQTIVDGTTVTIKVELFRTTPTGNGGKPDLSNSTFTVTLSDESTFDVMMGMCE